MTISTLTINLSALRANYQLLKAKHAKNSIAAVVKANAYGLGMEGVSKALWTEGCRDFFVATLDEAIELRKILPEATIGVFSGLFAGEEREYLAHNIIPVLNDISQVERFVNSDLFSPYKKIMLHVDTGMTRLGLSENDLRNPILSKLSTQHSALILSHLACAPNPSHPKNTEQLESFKNALKYFPNAKASLANSAGVFLGEDFHFDIARTGCALYGINPTSGKNPMRHVATLSAPIIQIRNLEKEETVGYDATYTAKKGSKIAIVGIGYADGYMRSLSNMGFAYVAGHKVPVIGRVSMDMIAIDISVIPDGKITENTRAELINEMQTVDDIAAQCDTIGYEVFTRIGSRVRRIYQ